MARAMLYDSTLCVGCRACEAACAERWGNPYNDKIAETEQISSQKLTTIQTHGDHFLRKLCNHCLEPTCVSVCPVGALEKTSLGPVVYDQDKCIGCRYCMFACPFQSITYEWDKPLPRVRKCDFCYDRQREGKVNACAEACPTGATLAGERDELLAEAQRRLRESPDNYYPKIYGVKQAGGTSVLYLSAVPFEQLGLKMNLPDEPLPQLTWNVLSHVPDIASVGTVLLGGIWWITHRRDEVSAAEARDARAVRQPLGKGGER